MIDGYKGLNESISKTINLISDIEMSSKEQLLGIEQINDAVNELDRQTQQNAMIATETNDIAMNLDEVAKLIVEDTNKKEFNGKTSVQAKNINTKRTSSNLEIAKKEVKPLKKEKDKSNLSSKESENIKTKSKFEVISDSSSNDEWESF